MRCAARGVALFTALLTVGAAAVQAADFPIRSQGRPSFLAEVVAVPAAAGSVQVAVSWQVPYRQLTFRQEDEWYRARYDVTVVFARKGKQVAGDVWHQRVRLKTLAETIGEGNARARKTMVLAAGDYDIRLRMTDRTSQAASGVEGRVRGDFRLSRVGLGDLEFVRSEGGTTTRNPAHDLALGESGHAVRFDLRPAAGVVGNLRIQWKIRDASRSTVFEGDSTVAVTANLRSFEFPVDTDQLSVGAHELEVRLEGPGKESDRRTARLNVRLTPRWFETRREDALEVFRAVADDAEWDRLRKAPEAEWERRVEEFWEGRDPSRGTPANEYRDEIQARMESAATLFLEPFRSPGWKTDRGQIMLKHGAPSRRSIRSADFDHPASEFWEYESPRRVFIFVDERGSGEYWIRG